MVILGPGQPEPVMEETEIPFHHVKWSMYLKLANKLDPVISNGNNWRMLADRLGYTTEHIRNFESQQTSHGRNTIKVLEDYALKKGASVNEVLKALEDIDRPDAVSELQAGLPEIEQSCREWNEQQKRPLVENEFRCLSCDSMAYPQGSYPSYSSSYCHKHSCMDKYGSPASSHQPVSMESANKHYHRTCSVESASGCMIDRRNGRLPGYEHSSPEFKRQRSMPPPSDSMMVHGRDNRSQYYRDMEPMDHAPSMREDPVPPALAMMRNRLPGYEGPMMGMSMMSSMMPRGHMPNMPNKDLPGMYHPQYGKSDQTCHERGRLKLEIPASSEMFGHRQGDFYSPSPTPTTPSTPLGHLKKLTSEKFQPDEGYRDLMRIKREEDMLQNKGGHMMHYDAEKMSNMTDCHTRMAAEGKKDERNRHSDEIVRGHTKVNEPPSTFPLRLKSNSCSSSSSSVSPPGGPIHKSVSLPKNMKPAEYKKAFRHIKVFVTYAADDKKHTQRVLNLCKCLDKNGFTCCVDIFHKELKEEERATWCEDRFEEVDFILVIVSPRYRREVDSCEMDQDADDSDNVNSDTELGRNDRPNSLHTKHIYKLMYEEYASQSSGHRSSRFVPVLFQGMNNDLIPQWMLCADNKLVYVWPKEYKDLLWMLTKPENRIPEHVTPVANRSLTDSTSENQDMSDSSEVNGDSE